MSDTSVKTILRSTDSVVEGKVDTTKTVQFVNINNPSNSLFLYNDQMQKVIPFKLLSIKESLVFEYFTPSDHTVYEKSNTGDLYGAMKESHKILSDFFKHTEVAGKKVDEKSPTEIVEMLPYIPSHINTIADVLIHVSDKLRYKYREAGAYIEYSVLGYSFAMNELVEGVNYLRWVVNEYCRCATWNTSSISKEYKMILRILDDRVNGTFFFDY